MQRRAELGILVDVPSNVLLKLLLEDVLAVNGIDRLPDVIVELAIVDLEPAALEQIDRPGEKTGFGECKQSVDPRVLRIFQLDPDFPV